MRDRLRICVPLLFFAVFLLGKDAEANGINPPRLKVVSTTTASCQERRGSQKHEILRARVSAGDRFVETLTIRLDAATVELRIDEIELLELTDGAVDKSGFTRATLVRRGYPTKESATVQVRRQDAALQLSGFDASGFKIAIGLANCRRMKFSAALTDDSRQYRREAKK